jgi:hypothetical protein
MRRTIRCAACRSSHGPPRCCSAWIAAPFRTAMICAGCGRGWCGRGAGLSTSEQLLLHTQRMLPLCGRLGTMSCARCCSRPLRRDRRAASCEFRQEVRPFTRHLARRYRDRLHWGLRAEDLRPVEGVPARVGLIGESAQKSGNRVQWRRMVAEPFQLRMSDVSARRPRQGAPANNASRQHAVNT